MRNSSPKQTKKQKSKASNKGSKQRDDRASEEVDAVRS